jgi:hypothetical protein
MLAAIRGPGQDFPVLLHIVGATVVFGALLASVVSIAFARGEVRLFRVGYFSLLLVGVPALILMRLSGQWIYQKQRWDDVPDKFHPTWLSIGFVVADWGALVLLVALVLGGIGLRRLRRGDANGATLLKATTVLSLVLIVGYVIAVWAMTGKPN